jgi:hypothetical protein
MIVTAGGDGKVLLVWYEPMKPFEVRTLHEHDGRILGLARVNPRMVAFADEEKIHRLDVTRGKSRPLARRRREPLRRLLSDGTWIVAADDRGFEAVRVEDALRHARQEPGSVAWCDLSSAGQLLVVMEDGSGVVYDLLSMARTRTVTIPGDGRTTFARRDGTTGALVYARGAHAFGVSSPNPGAGLAIATEPVAMADACLCHGVLVHADHTRRLGIHRFRI